MSLAMLAVGYWVSQRIKDVVVANAAVSSAMFMESFISPLAREMASEAGLSPPARQALIEIFAGTTLGERIADYTIWSDDGTVLHSSNAAVIGQVFIETSEREMASRGEVTANFYRARAREGANPRPVLQVFSPVRAAWTGEIVAVVEFNEWADALANELEDARRTAWLVVGAAFLVSGLLLYAIVLAGSRTILRQRKELEDQLSETRRVSLQNEDLRQRAVEASSRAIAQTERAIRRTGMELHDGPAQYIALANLRLDSVLGHQGSSKADGQQVRASLDKALEELRIISRGLAVPDLDKTDIATIATRIVNDHELHSAMSVDLTIPTGADLPLNYAQKLCVYRFLQEALSNVARHAEVDRVEVGLSSDGRRLAVRVADEGNGFDGSGVRTMRRDGGQGLFGLTDRAESIGGELVVWSQRGAGTILTLTLPMMGPEA